MNKTNMFKLKIKSPSASNLTRRSKLSEVKTQVATGVSNISKKESVIKSVSRMTKISIKDQNRFCFFEMRKQSLLNSYYNKRKNALVSITKENKKIYERINSQKSQYSSRNLNKSYESLNSSRASQRSNRSNSSVTKNAMKKIKYAAKQAQSQPILKMTNVNSIKNFEMSNFQKIFNRKVQQIVLPPKPPKSHKLSNNQNIATISQYPDRFNSRISIPKSNPILKIPPMTTPQRPLKQSNLALPSIKQKTPQRVTVLQKIMQNMQHRLKY